MTRPEANHILNFVRAGGEVSQFQILLALWTTGDLDVGIV